MMLSYQNLHQFVFNLSQVTSAVSSVKITTGSVKKQQGIGVCCRKSLLRALGTCQNLENVKISDVSPHVKFGDDQLIYVKDFNLKLTTKDSGIFILNKDEKGKKVSENDFYISFNKKLLRHLSHGNEFSKLFKLEKNGGHIGKKQKQLLEKFEKYLLEKSVWDVRYVPGKDFNFSKNSSFSHANNMKFSKKHFLFSNFNKNYNTYTSSPEFLKIQKRGFKTRRSIEAEERLHPGFLSRVGEKMGLLKKESDSTVDHIKSNKYLEMVSDESLSAAEKTKLKVSFAEGYMVASNELKKASGSTITSKFYSLIKFASGVLVVFLLVGLYKLGGQLKVLKINFVKQGQINPEEVSVTFSDVKGVQEVKEELEEIVEFLRNPGKFISLGGKLPKGVLLVGPPGTGKTLLARAVAGEANVPFFYASGSEFDEIFVGEGARRLRNLFKSAKAKAPSIIFIDEIDCIGSKRRNTALHPYANQTINQLLSEMDGFQKNEGVIVLGATNRRIDLDQALLRPGRFDFEVLVPLPDLDARKEILQHYIGKIMSKDIDVVKIAKATAGFTGADLEAIINHAAIRAATEGAPYVTTSHIESAKDKIKLGPERKSAMKDAKSNLMTAYHEGGHTIVAYFTEEAGGLDKVTIIPRGEALGHTSVVPEDLIHLTKAMCLARLDVMLGGRAAEELIFGVNNITANASNDLENATLLAGKMVRKWGMSDKLGLRTMNCPNEDRNGADYSVVIGDQIDAEVKRIIQESYERAKNILKKHAKEHKLLAEALIKYKTLNPEDIRAILDGATDKSSASSASVLN